jgi:hypothetical protein
MSKNTSHKEQFIKRHFIGLFLVTIIALSLFVPALFFPQTPDTPLPEVTDPIAEDIITPPQLVSTVAGEPNYTRESWPFVLNNYPDFSWENPGQFDDGTTSNGASSPATINHNPGGPNLGYNPSLTAPGVGAEAYPEIYEALEGLNESNIRIMYLDANYDWISAPYQIDHKGWVNIWNLGDLNRWAGLEAHQPSALYGEGGGPHVAADGTVGLGWVGGDFVTSDGHATATWPINDLKWDWYRIPTWTYVSPFQADGSITDETLDIDAEYRDHLIWCYMQNSTNYPHKAWLEGDTGGTGGKVNAWNSDGSTSYPRGDSAMNYHNYRDDARWPAFVNLTSWPTVQATDFPRVDSTGWTNVLFMGDTWFQTPGDYTNNPQWVRDAYPYQQINGALDKDDEICFYAYPGRKAASWYWWNYSYFPHRFELEITDPIDGGRTWMYIYFNNESWADPFTGGVNLGKPIYSAPDRNGDPTQDYLSWDPDLRTITSDYYQVSFNTTNPTLVDSVSIFGDTDGQPIAKSFNRMYLYGYVEETMLGQWSDTWTFGKEGVWYTSGGASQSFSEMIACIENPSVTYPGISRDTGVTRTYYNGETTGDRTSANHPGGTSADPYRGPQGIVRNPSDPPLQDWERNYGDGRAVIDGPCRIIFYTQQWLVTGLYVSLAVSGTTVVDDYVDLMVPIMDGPSFYYRRAQIAAEALVEIPSLPGFIIQIYYAYIMCGEINPDIRSDVNFTTASEWNGGPDERTAAPDSNTPTFGWANEEGYTKQGGLDPTTTTYTILGTSIFDGDGGTNDYYGSQGYPMLNVRPDQDATVCPPDGNNGGPYGTYGTTGIPDWAMATSETHGGIWLFIPRREVFETIDNTPYDYGGGLIRGAGYYGQPKMYFRDDTHSAEFGVALDGGVSPWVQGGTKTSPYKMMMIYDDFKPDDWAMGHTFYLYYFFDLEGAGNFRADPAPDGQFIYDSVTPDQLIYKTGDTITVDITGTPTNTVIDANFADIDVSDSDIRLTNDTEGEWTLTYNLDAVDGSTSDYERNIQFTADCLEPMYTTDTIYNLEITIDNVAPTAAQLAALPGTTAEASVMLDWSASPGSDVGSASVANPSGLGKYRIRRGTTTGVYDTILADDIPITTTQFLDSFVVNGEDYFYVLDTYDEVENMATSTERSTTIDLPYTPAQPDDLPATVNPAFTLDWTDNPGYGAGVTINGYFVYYATSTDGSYPSAGSYALAPGGNVGASTTWTSPASLTEATYYFLKVLTDVQSGTDLYSSPVVTRCDTVAPLAAELATPLPTYNAEKEEIIVSWSIELLDQYQSAGSPGQDLNGIDHWIIYKKTASGPWTTLTTVPYGSTAEDQRYLDIAVSDGVQYSYAIETVDAAGNSALCQINKTTTLNVVGAGRAEVYTVTAATDEVQQGQEDVEVTVEVRNGGATSVTLNDVKLYFLSGSTDVTSEYSDTVQSPGSTLTAGETEVYVFTIDVSASATTGLIDVDAETVYDTTQGDLGALHGADQWNVLPNASLSVKTVSSSVSTVHPGEEDIPVTVTVKNSGTTNVTLEDLTLSFKRGETDMTDKFMVEEVTTIPTTPFTGELDINLLVTVSQSITTGGITIDATASGTAAGVPLSDTDGAATTKTWAVTTWPKPVIASVTADKSVYWAPPSDVITLTVTCDDAGHTVVADFTNVESGSGNQTGSPTAGANYEVSFTLNTPVGEGTYDVIVYATNATGADSYTIPIRLGQAPTFGSPVLTPPKGQIDNDESVAIDININDNGGADNVDAYLKYRVDGGSWIQKSMTYAGSGDWDVTIPGQAGDSDVDYIINASDLVGNWATLSDSYTVNPPPTTPILVEGSESIHAAGDPGTVYNETPGFGAPIGDSTEYSVSIDTSFVETPDWYVVVVSAFDPIRQTFIDVNDTVWMEAPVSVDVTLSLFFDAALITSPRLITGKIFVLTDLPSNGGRTVSVLAFSHYLE